MTTKFESDYRDREQDREMRRKAMEPVTITHHGRVLAVVAIPHQHSVTLHKKGRNFIVVYGKQVTETVDRKKAEDEFTSCVFHAIECNGDLS